MKINFTPQNVAIAAFWIGAAFAIAGVFLLFGAGWALIAAATQAQVLALLLLRGLNG